MTERSRGFVGVTRPATGQYCLEPEPELDLSDSVASVGVDWSFSVGNNLSAFWRSTGALCPDGQLAVLTFRFEPGGGNTASDNVSFTVVVP